MKLWEAVALLMFGVWVVLIASMYVQAEASQPHAPNEFQIWRKAMDGAMYENTYYSVFIVKHHPTGACWLVLGGNGFQGAGLAPAPREVCESR